MNNLDVYTIKTNGFFLKPQVSVNSNGNRIFDIIELASFLEERNVLLNSRALEALSESSDEYFQLMFDSFREAFYTVDGSFLRGTFATKNKVKKEPLTSDEAYIQMEMYFYTYGLGVVPKHLFNMGKDRKVKNPGDTKDKKEKRQELNKNLKIIDAISLNEFQDRIKEVIEMPIVFGATQREFIGTLFEDNKESLIGTIKESTIKVKENLFSLVEICGLSSEILEMDVIKTHTDILRLAYLFSGLNYRELDVQNLKLKTSQKRVIMVLINRITEDKKISDVYEEMKRYRSQWLKVANQIHPNSAKNKKYRNAFVYFDLVRNIKGVPTFNSTKVKLINDFLYKEYIDLMCTRPGELLRTMDYIIRTIPKKEIDYLVEKVKDIDLNPKLVVQVKSWLKYRKDNSLGIRTFKVKDKLKSIEDKPLDKLKEKRTQKVIDSLEVSLFNHLVGKELF